MPVTFTGRDLVCTFHEHPDNQAIRQYKITYDCATDTVVHYVSIDDAQGTNVDGQRVYKDRLSFSENKAAGLTREPVVTLYAQNADLEWSDGYEIESTNPQPTLPSTPTVQSTSNGVIVNIKAPADVDVAGYRIWKSATSPVVKNDANLVIDGPETSPVIPLTDLATYYIVVAPYDSFDKAGLNASAEISVQARDPEDGLPISAIQADIDAAEEAIADLVDTYGITISAAAHAAEAAAAAAAAIVSATDAADAAADAAGFSSAAQVAETNAETAEANAEAAQALAETAQGAAEDAQAAADTAQGLADAAATAAATSATNAGNSATSASGSATTATAQAAAAATSATTAATSATNAGNSATAAATSATNAGTSATAAGTSATSAATSATTATTQAGNASTSATNASNSATTALGHASSASTSATNAANSATAAGTSATAASGSASTAATQATAAGTSAGAANTSATNAATSAGAASTSATNASNSATTASGHAATASTQATNAANSATAAGGSATAAAGSASTASTQATNAGNSATSAASSAVSASSYRDQAALTAALLLPDRYMSATDTSFTNLPVGAPDVVGTVATNYMDATYGPIFQYNLANTSADWGPKGVVPAIAGRVYEATVTYEVVAYTGSPSVQLSLRHLDETYASIGAQANTHTVSGTGVFTDTYKISNVASSGIVAWTAGSAWIRPYVRTNATGGGVALTVRYRTLTIRDVTERESAAGSATAASTSASTATTHATNAGTSAAAAAGSATTAATQAGNASTSATNASTSATTAAGHASTAATQAGNAATSAGAANTSATAASGSASSAATQATNAGNSATSAAASDVSAKLTAAALLPRDFLQDGKFWFNGYQGDPAAVTSITASSIYTFPTVAGGIGKVIQAAAGVSIADCGSVGVVKAVDGRTYKITATMRRTAGSASGTLYAIGLDQAYLYVAPASPSVSPTWTGSWQTMTVTVTGNQVVSNGGTYIRPMLRCPASTTIQISSIVIEDVTDSTAAGASASAAATSASTANTHATNAGTSATAASGSATTAATQAGNASTSAGNAAASATTASGHASSASTSATTAASSAAGARMTVAASLPSDFSEDGKYWNYTFTGDPTTSGPLPPSSIYSYWTGTSGRIIQVVAPGGTYADLSSVGVIQVEAGRTYRVTAYFRCTAGGVNSSLYLIALNSTYAYVSGPTVAATAVAGAGAWTSVSVTQTATALIAGGAAFIRPMFRTAQATTYQIASLLIEDVTGETAAASSASAAATSASTAGTQATNAGTSATAASTSATGASTSAGNASTSATNASTSASSAATSASSASSSASLAASIGQGALNKNSGFDNYTSAVVGAYPTDWGGWAGSSQYRVADPQGGYAMRQPGAAGTNAGVAQDLTGGPQLITTNGYYVIEADVELHTGTFAGAGVYVGVYDQSIANANAYLLHFNSDPDITGAVQTSPTAGRSYSFRKIIKVTGPTNAKGFVIYAMSHYTSMSGGVAVANDITWRKCMVRPATSTEVRDQTVLTPMEATVSTQGTTIASHTGSLASLSSTVSTQGVTISSTSSALTTAQGNITTLFGKAGLTVDVGGRVTGWALNNNGSTGEFNVVADKFSVVNPSGGAGLTWIDGVLWNKGTSQSVILGQNFGSTSNLLIWAGPNPATASAATKANGVFWIDNAGDAYFGGSLSAGVMKNSAQTTLTSSTASIELGPFGSNGGTRSVVVSYSAGYWANWFDSTPPGGNPTWSGTPSCTFALERWNGSTWTSLQSLTVTGTTAGLRDVDTFTIDGDNGGSFTFSDTSGGTSIRYRARITSRTDPTITSESSWSGGSGTGTIFASTQNLSIISTEA